MYELIIIGAGPGGISMAAEARAIGINAEQILILEKGREHSWAIRKFYPEAKAVLANYKGIDAVCTGVMCISDMSKEETLSYLDRAIKENELMVHYNEAVQTIRRDADGSFFVETNNSSYQTQRCVIAIGILDKPNKPDYPIPFKLKERVHFDITSVELKDQDCLVIGGGDTAAEYCQYLFQQGNRVTLSYRRTEFSRLNRVNHQSLMAMETRGQVKILRGSNISKLEDEEGRPRVSFLETELPARVFDHIVYSLGGTTPTNFLKTIGIDFVGDAPVLKQGYETSIHGLYLIGDLSAGKKGGSINLAFNMAADAMRHICSDIEDSGESLISYQQD